MRENRIFWPLSVLLAVLLSGCALKPIADSTQFYVLTAGDYQPVSSGEPGEGIIIGMAKVKVARYLDSPSILLRERENRIHYSKSHHWAESLENGVARVLMETLRKEPAVSEIVTYPNNRNFRSSYDLHVSVLRAEGWIENGESRVVFQARWELEGRDGRIAARNEINDFSIPWDGKDMEKLVSGLSDSIRNLSQQIALEVEKL